MAYKISWMIEERLLLSTFTGVLTQMELQVWVYELDTYIHSTRQKVHHISDSHGMEGMDISIGGLRTFLKAFKRPAHFGWHVEVRPQSLNHMVIAIVNQVLGMQIQVCQSMEEALCFLEAKDPSLVGLAKHLGNAEEETDPNTSAV